MQKEEDNVIRKGKEEKKNKQKEKREEERNLQERENEVVRGRKTERKEGEVNRERKKDLLKKSKIHTMRRIMQLGGKRRESDKEMSSTFELRSGNIQPTYAT